MLAFVPGIDAVILSSCWPLLVCWLLCLPLFACWFLCWFLLACWLLCLPLPACWLLCWPLPACWPLQSSTGFYAALCCFAGLLTCLLAFTGLYRPLCRSVLLCWSTDLSACLCVVLLVSWSTGRQPIAFLFVSQCLEFFRCSVHCYPLVICAASTFHVGLSFQVPSS